MTSRWQKLIVWGGALVAVAVLGLAGIIVVIRSSLTRFSDDAVARFPGDRIQALTQVVDCSSCTLNERNHAVWSLGQMEATTALTTLMRHYDGGKCTHETRLCQYELQKAIRMIETRHERSNRVWRFIGRLHQPWS